MNLLNPTRHFRASLSLLITCVACAGGLAQSFKPTITLAKQDASDPGIQSLSRSEALLASKAPANYRHFGKAAIGEITDVQKLILQFEATAKLTGISSTPDFKVEQGSSCVIGNVYTAKSICTLLVRFTPRGAGYRLGKLTVAHSGTDASLYVGLGGNGYAPVVSFVPALITTVPATRPSGVALLNGAQNLAVDGGDSLYIADTGNNVIRYMDSSGNLTTISSGTLSAPVGVAADSFGDVYFSEPASRLMYEIFNYGSQLQVSGTGTDSCTVAAPCKMPNETLYAPGQLAIDSSNQLFFAEQSLGAAISTVLPYSPTFARIYDPFTYQEATTDAFTVDQYDDLISFWNTTGVCAIVSQYYSDAANSRGVYKKIAGGRACGFSGDGGQARNAEIGTRLGQMAFDVAGNLYLTDMMNNRVRRIDATTGIIQTIAGNGTTGYHADGGPATSASVASPAGIAVDSQGQVYVISAADTTNTTQVVRKLGTTGYVSFIGHTKGTVSAARTITISNTGNTTLNVTRMMLVGTNPTDFAIDPNTTSCNFTTGGTLANGQSCLVGIIFKPSGAGTRSAQLILLDNTVTNSNTATITGTGVLPSPTFKIVSPAAGASFTSGTTVAFKVSVTSTSSPTPTGSVSFKVDGATFGSPVTVTSGAASINLTGLTTKAHSISATYSGDANYATATATETITVVAAAKAKTAMTLSAMSNPASLGHPVVFLVAVTSDANASPKGEVLLSEGTKLLAKAALTGPNALLSVPKLRPGTHVVTAAYDGDSSHTSTTSPALKLLVR